MGKLVASGHEIINNPTQAEMIIINTCAFIKPARDEAYRVIKEMAKHKKKLYVAGCLPKFGIRHSTFGIDGIINSIGLFNSCTPRIKATPPWYAYVKIAEGCNNRCSYCTVPKIRGKLRLRKVNDVLKEVKLLAKRGVKEIIYVAQDTTAHPKLPVLLQKTARIRGIRWIRVLYAHPAHVTDKLLNTMASERKVVKYLDLPIQHACDKILSRMNRRYTRRDLEKLISKIRRRSIVLRTSVIVGFPGEGEAEFQELLDFIRAVRFEKLGVFPYWKEEGTPAAKIKTRGQGSIKKLMRLQTRISQELNNTLIGKTFDTLIEGASPKGYLGRTFRDAPDIDGQMLVDNSKTLKPGEIVKVRITGAKTYDLIGSPV